MIYYSTWTVAVGWILSCASLAHSFRSLTAERHSLQRAFVRLAYSNDPEVVDPSTKVPTQRYAPVLSAVTMDLTLSHHRPLGCVIEESLAPSAAAANHHVVFVASVTPDGCAAQAGLLPGDVLVGISNSLLQQPSCDAATTKSSSDTTTTAAVLTNVTGWGIDKVYVLSVFIRLLQQPSLDRILTVSSFDLCQSSSSCISCAFE